VHSLRRFVFLGRTEAFSQVDLFHQILTEEKAWIMIVEGSEEKLAENQAIL